MQPDDRHQQLINWLREQGHTPAEIDKIVAKVREYDQRTVHESVFDSIERGSFDLKKIIREALEEGSV
jgi:DNA-binding transcriptional MerR regulator